MKPTVPEGGRTRWEMAGVLLLALAVHAPTLGYDFTGLDDRRLILESQDWLQRPDAWLRVFSEDVFHRGERGFFYRPLLSLSLVFDAHLGGTNPLAYHATNVVVHLFALAAFMVLLEEFRVSRGWAVLAAAWFAVHPALVQAVAWIPGRNDSLLALWVFLSLFGWLRIVRSGRWWSWVLHVVGWILALLAKESALVLPALVVLHGALFARNWFTLRRVLALAVVWATAGGLWLALRRAALGDAAVAFGSFTPGALASRAAALLAYLGKAVVPLGPSVYTTAADLVLWPGWLALALVVTRLSFCRGESLRRGIFGLAWFVVFLTPVLVKPERSGELELLDHRLYVALAGLVWLLPAGSAGAAASGVARRAVRALAGVALVASLSAVSLVHARHFRNERSFWNEAVRRAPHSAFVFNSYGALAYREGRYEEAERAWLRALELDPQEPLVRANLGLIYLRRSDLARAASYFLQETRIAPGNPAGYFWLGVVRWRQGDRDAAVRLWWRALDLDPRFRRAYERLARAYAQRGDEGMLRLLAERARRAGVRLSPPREAQPTRPRRP